MSLETNFSQPVYTEKQKIECSLWQILKEDWKAHDRDWTKPGFRAIAVHRFGVWSKTVKPKILQIPLRILYGMLYRKIRNSYGIEIFYTTDIGRRVVIQHQGGIVIHAHASIGDGCIIRQGVTLGMRYPDQTMDAPTLGKNVDVGSGAAILGHVNIGDNAKIGANSVVLKDVPPGATAVGVPAKIISC